jgi:hypothetical protein
MKVYLQNEDYNLIIPITKNDIEEMFDNDTYCSVFLKRDHHKDEYDRICRHEGVSTSYYHVFLNADIINDPPTPITLTISADDGYAYCEFDCLLTNAEYRMIYDEIEKFLTYNDLANTYHPDDE